MGHALFPRQAARRAAPRVCVGLHLGCTSAVGKLRGVLTMRSGGRFDQKLFDEYNGVWHCFVGRNFGAYMTHEANHHVYFYFGQMAVLLFKTG